MLRSGCAHRLASRLVLLPALFLLHNSGLRAQIRDGGVDPSNLGKGDWLYQLPHAVAQCNGNVPVVSNTASLMIWLKNRGMSYVIVKAGTSSTLYPSDASPQFTSGLVDAAHAAGLKIFGYNRSYGTDIPGEIAIADFVFNQGGDGFVFDAEIEWESQNLPDNLNKALQLCSGVRANWPNKFLGHAPFPIISYHSSFPYKEFGYYCDTVMPQDYWIEIGYTPSFMVSKMDTEWRNWQNSLSGLPPGSYNGTTLYWTNSIKPIAADAQGWSSSSGTITASQINEFVNALKTDGSPATTGGYKSVNYWVCELHPSDVWDAIQANNIGTFPSFPVIGNVSAGPVADTTANITWTTDQPCDSVVEYGPTTGYGTSVTNTTLIYYRTIVPAGLSPNSTYHYRVKSKNAANHQSVSADYVFTTSSASLPDVIVESRTAGGGEQSNPPYSDSGFSDSTLKSTATPLTGSGSRYAFSGTPSFTLRPTLGAAGGTFDVYNTHGSASSVSPDITVAISQSGGTGLPSSTTVFRAAFANEWDYVGRLVLNAGVTVPVLTFTYSSGTLNSSSGRFYSDAVKFVYIPPPPSGPSISTQPQSQSVNMGNTASLTVVASGTSPLVYQWRLNGTNLPGANLSSFTKNNVQPTDAGTYSVVITNTVNAVTSATATLTVFTPPSIAVQPTNVTTGLGLSAAFAVTASGSAPLAYQWRLNAVNLAGATTNVLTLNNIQATNAGSYSVVVTNAYGTILSADGILTVADPYLTSQPQNQSVGAGATANFNITAVGTAPLSFYWKKEGLNLADGGRISGSHTANLTVSNVQGVDMGNYSVLVSNLNGSALSASATLLAPYAPIILTPPAAHSAVAGSPTTFTVGPFGPGPFAYQWRKEGVNLAETVKFSGTTNNPLLISNPQSAEMANYSVVVTNSYGSVTSAAAFLSLFPMAAWGLNLNGQTDIAPGLTNMLAIGCGGSHQLAVRSDGTVAAWGAGTNNTGFNSQFGQAMPPAGLTNVVSVTGGSSHSLALKADGTVVAFGAGLTNSGVSPDFGQSIVPNGLTNVVGIAAGASHSLAVKSDGTVVGWGLNSSGQTNAPSNLTNAIAVAAGGSWSLALRADGSLMAWGSNSSGQTNVPSGLTNAVAIACGNTFGAALRADGTVIAWGANGVGQTNTPTGLTNGAGLACGSSHGLILKSDGTLATWGSNSQGQTNVPTGLTNVILVAAGGSTDLVLEGDGQPRITIQPLSQQTGAGRVVRLTALAVGVAPLSYQWQKNGANVPGASTPSLVLPNAQYRDSGSYALMVTNPLGSTASATAVLTVPSAPVLGAQPASQTVVAGTSVTFTVGAVGTTPLSYQWRFNSAPIPAATAASYALPSAQSSDAGDYSVTVTNALGSATSSNAALTVLVGPTIVTQPTNQTAVAGANVSFSVSASGSAPLSYQWFFNQTNPLSSATSQTLTLTNVQPADAGAYSAVVTNLAGSATTSNATLTVNVPPAITAEPQSLATNAGANVSFSVTATGTAPLTYQWRFNTSDVSGATASSYQRSNVQSSDAGSYSVLVSNVAGTRLSADAVLTLLSSSAPHIDSITLLSGQGFQLQLSGGPGNFAIQVAPGLSGWTQLSTLTATGATFQFTDPDTNQATRFYRLQLLP